MGELKQKVAKGAVWALLEKFTTQLANFCVTLLLARLLTPNDYGTVALLTVLVTISGILVDCSFGQALVQKKDANDLDFNSVFYLSVVLSLVVYLGLWAAAPFVASFYSRPELTGLLRVLSITIVIGAVNGVQNAELNRKLLFNMSFRISLVRFVMTSVTGLTLAWCGFGPWAIVWSTVVGSLGGVMASWYYIAWRPKWMFSFSALKGLFSYGWKISFSWFLSCAYDNVYSMIIGKLYSPAELAFYQKGRQLPSLGMASINGTIHRVSFPAIAQIQDDLDHVRSVMRRMIKCSTFLVFPLLTGLAVCSNDMIPICYGDQWERSVPFLALACFSFLLHPFHTINLQVLSAIGRSDIFLKLEIIKKIVAATALVCTYKLGVLWMVAVGAFVVGPIGVAINAYPNQKILRYSVLMQLKDTMPTAMICVGMAVVILPIGMLPVSMYMRVPLEAIAGGCIFMLLAWAFRLDPLREYALVLHGAIGDRVPKMFCETYALVMRHLEVVK